MKRLRLPTLAELQQSLETLVDWFGNTDNQRIDEYVVKLRAQNPGISDDELARKIVNRKSFKCGLIGAATGLPGGLALPFTVPADLIATWRIQIVMAVAIARVYGHTAETTDLKTDIYLILAGNAAKEALQRVGVNVGMAVTKKAIDRVITREIMKQIWKVIPQKIITKAGQRSLLSFTKMVPLIGAPIGFAFDYPAARIVGSMAIHYYSGRGGDMGSSKETVECPKCGKRNELQETFRCVRCETDNICLQHQDSETFLCNRCASRARRVTMVAVAAGAALITAALVAIGFAIAG